MAAPTESPPVAVPTVPILQETGRYAVMIRRAAPRPGRDTAGSALGARVSTGGDYEMSRIVPSGPLITSRPQRSTCLGRREGNPT